MTINPRRTVESLKKKQERESAKLCVDCKWHCIEGAFDLCKNPKGINVVTGESQENHCLDLRYVTVTNQPACGYEGKWWEAKDE